MEKKIIMTDTERKTAENLDYNNIVKLFKENLEDAIKNEQFLFRVEKHHEPVMALYDVFLTFLPDSRKQHYNCHTCRKFINDMGRLVYFDSSDKKFHSAMIRDEDVERLIADGNIFADSVKFMKSAIESRDIASVYRHNSDGDAIGTAFDGYFNHFYTVGHYHHSDKQDDFVAETEQSRNMLLEAIDIYPDNVVSKMVTLLANRPTQTRTKFLNNLKNFQKIADGLRKEDNKKNLAWVFAVSDPNMCRIKNSVLGASMDKIKNGDSDDSVIKFFETNTDGIHYMRPTAAPSQGQLFEAEKRIKELGFEDSLKRRYANIEDITSFDWQDRALIAAKKKATPELNIFKDIKPRQDSIKAFECPVPYSSTDAINAQTLNYSLFRESVLPKCKHIFALTDPRMVGNYLGVLTEAVKDSKPIVKWGNPVSWFMYQERSNSFSWLDHIVIWNEVTMISRFPNHWNSDSEDLDGHMFFLDNAHDKKNPGLGLFPEMLVPELYDIRQVIEKYSDSNHPENQKEATAGVALFTHKGTNIEVCVACQMNDDAWKVFKVVEDPVI